MPKAQSQPTCLGPLPPTPRRFAALAMAALIVVGGGLGSERPAHAQTSVFYGEADAILRAELAQWSIHYWNRVETGATVNVGAFAFTNDALNKPLFNPLRGARPTLEQLNIVSASDCDGLAALQPGWGNAAVSTAFRAAMKDWQFSTDSQTNASGTSTHISLITSSGAGWTSQGNLIISTDLPLEQYTGTNENPTVATSISTATQNAINKLILVGSIIASASAGTSEAQAIITGEESHATKFERGVQETLASEGSNATTWRVDAAFGVFGSLPLVGVTFADAFVLLDSTNGTLDGPFAISSELNAFGLLSAHVEYTSTTHVVFFNTGGCKMVAAPHKEKVPCPPGTPAGTCLPPGFIQHGTPSPWSCNFVANPAPTPGGTCVCTTEYRYIAPAPCPGSGWNPPMDLPQTFNRCIIFEKVTCSGGGANCSAAGCANQSVPGTSPPAPPGSAACTPSCTSEYWYWAQ